MPHMDRLSNYRTTWTEDGDRVVVCYVRTNIVKATAGAITLNSGGWQTVTTKRKMNQAARQFGLGYSVFQKAGDWFVIMPGATAPVMFYDGMTFARSSERAA